MKTFLKYQLREYFFYSSSFFIIFNSIITLIVGILNLQKFIELNPSLYHIFCNFGLLFVELTTFTLPLSTFMGVLFALHRFKDEKELLAFYSLGFSSKELLKPLYLFIFFSFVITFVSHFYFLPRAKKKQKIIKIELIKKQLTHPFPVKKPIPLGKNYILYVSSSKKKKEVHRFKKVFFLEKGKEKSYVFITKEGKFLPKEKIFELVEGWGFSLDKKKNIEVLKFKNYKFIVNLKNLTETPSFSREEHTFLELKSALNRIKKGTTKYYKYLTEYYGRIFYPFSIFFLLLQAFLLGLWIKTSHKFFLFFAGVFVYLLFYVCYDFWVSLGENGKIYPLYSFFLFYFLISIILLLEFLIFKKQKGVLYL